MRSDHLSLSARLGRAPAALCIAVARCQAGRQAGIERVASLAVCLSVCHVCTDSVLDLQPSQQCVWSTGRSGGGRAVWPGVGRAVLLT